MLDRPTAEARNESFLIREETGVLGENPQSQVEIN